VTAFPPRVPKLMGKARHDLGLAEKFLALAPEQAARLGYMAAFHACRAVVLAATGKEPKTHSGVRSAFGELVIKEQALGRELGRYISAAYESKDIADYQTEYEVDLASAERVVTGARELVGRVSAFLGLG
jgi:uncharacterized protein (UPF0332 family)